PAASRRITDKTEAEGRFTISRMAIKGRAFPPAGPTEPGAGSARKGRQKTRKRKADSRSPAWQLRAGHFRRLALRRPVRAAPRKADTRARRAPQRPAVSCRGALPPVRAASG